MLHGAHLMHLYIYAHQTKEYETIWVQMLLTTKTSSKLYIKLSFEEHIRLINCNVQKHSQNPFVT